ncbi:protein JTB [Neosynchiropus ocellatus]
MEGGWRVPVTCCRPRVLLLHALFWTLVTLRVFGSVLLSEDKSESPAAPCWLLEDFVVTAECSQCTAFQSKSWTSCAATGYVERVNCTRSNRDEYKSCRSFLLDDRLFWRFESVLLVLTVLFAFLVVKRQRRLDRLASEKVRRQIESI